MKKEYEEKIVSLMGSKNWKAALYMFEQWQDKFTVPISKKFHIKIKILASLGRHGEAYDELLTIKKSMNFVDPDRLGFTKNELATRMKGIEKNLPSGL